MKVIINDAKRLIEEHYPNCDGALLCGSVVRGEATATSDLDIVIFNSKLQNGFRESIIYKNWPVEIFAHSVKSFEKYFKMDKEDATPSLQKMVCEGIVLKAHPYLEDIKKIAQKQLDEGPDLWSAETCEMKRYFITDLLDDFIGCDLRSEGICIAGALMSALHEFYLRTNKRWIGKSKWIIRALENYNPEMKQKFVEAFEAYYTDTEKKFVEALVDEILTPFGGRLFEGFERGK